MRPNNATDRTAKIRPLTKAEIKQRLVNALDEIANLRQDLIRSRAEVVDLRATIVKMREETIARKPVWDKIDAIAERLVLIDGAK